MDSSKSASLRANVTNPEQSALVRWKTDAWQDAGMVDWYAGRMDVREATNQLKNALEIRTLKRHVRGPTVLDIGTGTGRAALPLIAEGYQVTGVDSSQSMLDAAGRLAGPTPITLIKGDLFDLPFEDCSFDSAVALNVLVHFPNWRESLREWRRVVRPGGRLIFDIHSLDHATGAYGNDKRQWPDALRRTDDPSNFSQFVSRVSVDDLVSFADTAGLSIAAVIPYGAFLGGGNVNWMIYEGLERTHRWKRVLSWFARDERLFELGLFLEEFVVSRLTPRIAGRMFVVLDNKADSASNAKFAADVKACDEAMDRHDVQALSPWLPLSGTALSAELARLLRPLRSKHFFYLLFHSLKSRVPQFNFRDSLPEDLLRTMDDWTCRNEIDQLSTKIARTWSIGCISEDIGGVDVKIGAEYHLVRDLLEKYFDVWSVERK
jgi:SAM-dependent methyltransferase